MKVNNFRELKVWQKAMALCKLVHISIANFPAEERYGLKLQLERCAVSIPSNIAEGCGRVSKNEFKQFLSISNASSFELETQLILAAEFNYISNENLEKILNDLHEIQKMIGGLYTSLN